MEDQNPHVLHRRPRSQHCTWAVCVFERPDLAAVENIPRFQWHIHVYIQALAKGHRKMSAQTQSLQRAKANCILHYLRLTPPRLASMEDLSYHLAATSNHQSYVPLTERGLASKTTSTSQAIRPHYAIDHGRMFNQQRSNTQLAFKPLCMLVPSFLAKQNCRL